MPASERATTRELASLRKLVKRAHERALSLALTSLEGRFVAWHEGQIDAFELNEEIHRFHHGVSRELYKLYVMSPTELAA